MGMPNIEAKLSQPIVILGDYIAMSYFSHVGWWALAGISLIVGLLTESNWLKFWFTLSVIFFILSIWKMGWVYF